ncbi:MAG: magnesium chelatase ATPase subunit I [Gemmatimonadales bacterium]|nr:MAG: magnesium chelatase ATPase subunit I [Gemmatimonadales bacterium]
MPRPFPFSAIVGQSEMKLALQIAAVDPTLGGVLIFGDRGTGKSTAIRALAALLPPIEVVQGCPYQCRPSANGSKCPHCDAGLGSGDFAPSRTVARKPPPRPDRPTASIPVPMVDLPLGATEDRVVGTLDLEQALLDGTRRFEPGLLARANRGFLYIDEVNLLDDHLVDLLLDVAASGENVVEREGISVRHPARFVLVGSGNPEEGDLRPQLLDRFGLSVEVGTPRDIEDRMEVLRRRDEYDRDPEGFAKRWAAMEGRIRAALGRARDALPEIAVPDPILRRASELCLALEIDGLRGELTLIRAGRALAALEEREAMIEEDLVRIAAPSLRHRLRRDPLDESGSTTRVQRALDELGL